MPRPIAGGLLLMGIVSLALTLPGCSIKATLNETTDTTSNVTGTTSGIAWWNEDGILLPEHKAIAFATYNHDNLEQDLARGRGEYITSLGSLLGVAEQGQAYFQRHAQTRFSELLPASDAQRLQQLRTLN